MATSSNSGVNLGALAGANWDGTSPPMPDYFVDAHAREFSRTAGAQFDASRLAERTLEILGVGST